MKIDDLSSLPSYSDGLQAALAFSPEQWKEQAIREGLHLARSGDRFTVENLQRIIAIEPESPKSWGAVIAYLRSRGLIERVN
ncbi:hypothetical protein [Neomicrococcus lactis]|uniref:hypothetical protein n=1 Tax=Neomicrococcus lactis TaxID=732241 RepID=UPI0023002458|nr:hypothetical protein [Neomicrococcus lactis]